MGYRKISLQRFCIEIWVTCANGERDVWGSVCVEFNVGAWHWGSVFAEFDILAWRWGSVSAGSHARCVYLFNNCVLYSSCRLYKQLTCIRVCIKHVHQPMAIVFCCLPCFALISDQSSGENIIKHIYNVLSKLFIGKLNVCLYLMSCLSKLNCYLQNGIYWEIF